MFIKGALGINTCEKGGTDAGMERVRSQVATDPMTASANSIGSSGVGRVLQNFSEMGSEVQTIIFHFTWSLTTDKTEKGCDLRHEAI